MCALSIQLITSFLDKTFREKGDSDEILIIFSVYNVISFLAFTSLYQTLNCNIQISLPFIFRRPAVRETQRGGRNE